MLKPNLLALAVVSVLAGHFTAARADASADAGTVQSSPLKPDAANAANTSNTSAADQPAENGDENTVNLGEIKVTGVRGAIEQAISVKKNSNEIIETISAEDIGKLPDNSIADSLARLPGITAQRVQGVESLISIRGFSGDFSGTLLNGREQVSTGDNRAVDFDQYPSELMSGLVVYKTPEASLVGQGISGTIDLQTVRPLDFDHRVVQVGARGEDNTNGAVNKDTDRNGYRINASYIDQFADHTFGIVVGYARLYSPIQDERWESYGYPTLSDGKTLVLGGGKAYADSQEGTRDALITTLQWRPNDKYESTLDLYWSKFNQDLTYRGFEVCTAYCGSTVQDPTIGDGIVTSGSFPGVAPVLRDELDAHNDRIFEIGWNNKFHFAEHWTATADLSYGKARSDQSFLEEYAGYVGTKDTFGFTLNPSTGLPTLTPGLNYDDTSVVKLTDPGGWGQDGYLKFPKVTDKLKAARFDIARDIDSPVSKFDAGINYNERTKTRQSDEWFLQLPGGGDTLPDGTKNSLAFPNNCLVGPSDLSYVGFPSTVAWDLNCILPLYNQVQNFNGDITAKDWTVEEKVTTAYAKIDIDTEVGGMPLRGNVGAQYIHTNQHSDAFATLGQATTEGGTSYSNFLPSMNLVLTMPDDFIGRLGAGKELARPRLDQEKASVEPSISAPPPVNGTGVTCQPTGVACLWTATGGNPELKPFVANAYDLSLEKYWDTKAYVQATYWYKQLKTYIYQQAFAFDFTGIPNPSANLVPSSNIGIFTRPANGTGGYMRGYELVASFPFDLVIAPLEGFGAQTSYAYSDSSIQPNGPGTSSPFPGLSKYVSQATLYYDRFGFSARIAATHRSDFLGEVQAFGADQSFVNIRAETVTDLQLEYKIQHGRFEGVDFLFQVNNLFNEPYKQFYADHSQPQQYTVYGRQILLGVNYKF